jgi:hypothetical protein
MREFTSGTPKGQEPVEVRKISFKLDKEVFTCTIRDDADSVLAWSELAATASAEDDMESAAGVAFVSRFFQIVMEPDEYARFRRHLKTHNTHPSVLDAIMESLDSEAKDAASESAQRPTVRSSSSSAGRSQTKEERRQQIALMQQMDADVEFAPHPNREARRKADRRMKAEAERATQGVSSAFSDATA